MGKLFGGGSKAVAAPAAVAATPAADKPKWTPIVTSLSDGKNPSARNGKIKRGGTTGPAGAATGTTLLGDATAPDYSPYAQKRFGLGA